MPSFIVNGEVREVFDPSMSSGRTSGQQPDGLRKNHHPGINHVSSSILDQAEDGKKKIGSQNLVSVLNDPTAHRNQTDNIFIKDWGSYFVEQATICPVVQVNEQRLRELKRCASKRSQILARFEEQNRLKAKMRNTSTLAENLEKIPSQFLQPDFDVQKEETLLFILSQNHSHDPGAECDIISPSSVRESQRILSDLLDLVEDHLSNQISARFRDFFQIMNAMDLVMDQVSRTIREVTSVRRKCDLLKRSLIKPCVQTILLTRIRYNTTNLLSRLSLMEVVHQSSYKVNILLSSKDYVRALDLVKRSRQVVQEQLSGIKSCQNLDSELREREKLIDQIMEQDLEKLLTTEWHQPLSHVPDEEYTCANEDLLVSITIGLLRMNKSDRIIDVFREEACAAVITVIKQTLIEALAAEDMDISNRLENHLFDQVKSIELTKWLHTLDKIFRKLSIVMKRIKCVSLIILRTIHHVHGKVWVTQSTVSTNNVAINSVAVNNVATNSVATNSVEVFVHDETSFEECRSSAESSFSSICDFAQARTSGFIERRLAESGDRFSLSDFKIFSSSVGAFAAECDALSGKKNNNLKSVLKTQASKFATRFHEERKKKVNSLLDIEQWKCMTSLPEDFPYIAARLHNGKTTRHENGDMIQRIKPGVSVEGESFVVVNSVVLLVNLIDEYCHTVTELPVLSADLLTRLLDLLNHFNNRTFELIYEQKAKQVAGLKVITSRILANSWRALQLIIKLIPGIKSIFSQVLSSKSHTMVNHFDDVKKRYVENVSKFQDKVLDSSLEVISSNLNKWEARPPVPSVHFMAITQHLTVLDANLEESIPPEQLVQLFTRIDTKFKESLKEHLRRLNIVNDGGPQYG